MYSFLALVFSPERGLGDVDVRRDEDDVDEEVDAEPLAVLLAQDHPEPRGRDLRSNII